MSNTAKYDLRIKRGEDFSLTFNIEVDDVVLNLANASIYSQIREQQNRQSDVVANFTVLLDGEAPPHSNNSNNTIVLSLTDSQTANITHTRGYYDVLVVDSANNDTFYLEGKVTFENSVTVKA